MNYLGFNQEKLTRVVGDLNLLLANYQIYYQNLRSFHWNIRGENFFELHDQFEKLYNDARLKIDEVAERILTLGNRPLSRLSEYLQVATIEESYPKLEDREMVIAILENHKILIANLRSIIENASNAKDEGTVDLASGFLETLEKKSWMLDAWSGAKMGVS